MSFRNQCTIVVACYNEQQLREANKSIPSNQKSLFISIGPKPSEACLTELQGRPHISMPNAANWHADITALLQRAAMLYTQTWGVLLSYADDLPEEPDLQYIYSLMLQGQKLPVKAFWFATREDIAIEGFHNIEPAPIEPSDAVEVFEPEELAEIIADTVPMFQISHGNIEQELKMPVYRRLMELLKPKFISRDDKNPRAFFVGRLSDVQLKTLQHKLSPTSRIVMLGTNESDTPYLKEYLTLDKKVIRIYPGLKNDS